MNKNSIPNTVNARIYLRLNDQKIRDILRYNSQMHFRDKINLHGNLSIVIYDLYCEVK